MKYCWLLMASCGLVGCGTVAPAYVEADRLTYQAIAPEYKHYVEKDANLSEAEKAMRLQTLGTWALRLAAAGAGGQDE